MYLKWFFNIKDDLFRKTITLFGINFKFGKNKNKPTIEDLRTYIMASQVNSKLEKYRGCFTDKNVVIIYDYDQSGQDGAIALSNTLKNAGAKVQIFDWNIVIKQFGFELSNGFDFTDLLVQNEKRKEKERKKVVEYGI